MNIIRPYITELLNLTSNINNGKKLDYQVQDFKDQINWLIKQGNLVHTCRLAFHPWIFNLDNKTARTRNPHVGIFNTTGSIFSYDTPINHLEETSQFYHDGVFSVNPLKLYLNDTNNVGSAWVVCIDENNPDFLPIKQKGYLGLILALPINSFPDIMEYIDELKMLLQTNLTCNQLINHLKNREEFRRLLNYADMDFLSTNHTILQKTAQHIHMSYDKGLFIDDYERRTTFIHLQIDLPINVETIPFFCANIKSKIPIRLNNIQWEFKIYIFKQLEK